MSNRTCGNDHPAVEQIEISLKPSAASHKQPRFKKTSSCGKVSRSARVGPMKVLQVDSTSLRQCWEQIRGYGLRRTKYHLTSHEQLITQSWKNLDDFPAEECVFCDYAFGGSGYPEMKVRNFGTIGVRHIMLRLYLPNQTPGAKDDASHFYCNDKRCINPRHLTYEDHDINISRFCCKLYGTGPLDYKCPHIPTCRGCNPCTERKE